MSSFEIDDLRSTDFAQWSGLWAGYNAFYRREVLSAVTEATWRRFFDDEEPMHALVMRDGEALVGFVHYIFHRHTALDRHICYLQDLFVAADRRGAGFGRRLIERVALAAAERGSQRVYWLTHETNRDAMALYDKLAVRSGFVQYVKPTGLA